MAIIVLVEREIGNIKVNVSCDSHLPSAPLLSSRQPKLIIHLTDLRGAIDHRCTFISHLKQLILLKSPRPFQSRKYGYSEKILPFLGSSRTKAVLCRLGIPYAGAGGEGWGWELKNSYFRPFFVKIRSFSTFGAINPPKCSNKPKKNDSSLFLCK